MLFLSFVQPLGDMMGIVKICIRYLHGFSFQGTSPTWHNSRNTDQLSKTWMCLC